jgi:NAD(P)-dependent dehydrogenase (short-subunit alcohol dehydrogenase family)
MSETVDSAALLRAGLLDGLAVLIASADDERGSHPTFGAIVGDSCSALGARVYELDARVADGDLAVPSGVDVLIVDAASLYDAASASRAGLRACLDGAWETSQAVANAAFIEPRRAGRIVYLAPRSVAGASSSTGLADAARAGLENLARTLSIEWARYQITTATIAPGASTTGEQVASLCAFLASPAGGYFSGCLLDLRGAAPAPAGR